MPGSADVQTCYTAWMKTNANMRICWQIVQMTAIFYVFWCSPSDEIQCIRLAHQIYSTSEVFDKIAQSLLKAPKILNAMQDRGGVSQNLCEASEQTWIVEPMALYHVPVFHSYTGTARNLFQRLGRGVKLSSRHLLYMIRGPYITRSVLESMV